ncbi:MAG: PIN domain-containing protein, partial [Cyanobacteria bacterium P01_G01_bin.49]
MRILLDADLTLEALLNRHRFVTDAEKAYKILQLSPAQGYMTSCGLEKIYSITQNINGSEAAGAIVAGVKEVIEICNVDDSIIQQTRLLDIKDPESAIEVSSALANNIWAILTLYPENFVGSNLLILSVKDLLLRQSLESQLPLICSPTPRINYKNLESTKSLTKSSKKPTQLTNWLENNFGEAFQSNWQSVEDIFEKKQITYRYRYAAMGMQWSKLAKKIDLGNGCLIALVVQVALNQLNEVDLLLQLYALNVTDFLSNNTKLIILDNFDKEFMIAKSKEKDIGIQL